MTKPCSQYTTEQISRFIDKELPDDQYQTLLRHQETCPACRECIETYTRAGQIFAAQVQGRVDALDPDALPDRLTPYFENNLSERQRPSGSWFGKNIYLKLASIVAILVIGTIAFQDQPSGPSAIVKSIDTDYSSVMIIETQKEKHTIIWFSET